MNRVLTDEQVTEALYRVCVLDEPMKAVAMDLGVWETTINDLVNKYEAREEAA